MNGQSPIGVHRVQCTSSDERLLSVLSYNILHKDWVTKDRYPYASEKHSQWKYRLPLIQRTILSYNADIICLQEVDIEPKRFAADFGDCFNNLGYDHIAPQYTAHRTWGNVILFNKTKYKCVYHEAFNRNTRQLITLFIDLQSISNCTYCCSSSMSDIICIHHAFFVINVHLTGHPQKHIQRLNEIKKVIERMNVFGGVFRSKEQQIKTIGFHSNINGKKHSMRILICGDFNSPKTALVDKLLINKVMDYDKIRIGNVSKQGQDISSNKRRIRFIFSGKEVGVLIGFGGHFINKLKNSSNATIIIPKPSTKIRTRVVIIIGLCSQVLKAIQMIIDRVDMCSLVMCIDTENIKCLDTCYIDRNSSGKIRISSRNLYNSTEKTIAISGDKGAMYDTVRLIIKQLFHSKLYIVTRMEYVPENVHNISNVFKHGYHFSDSYHDGLVSYLKGNASDDNNKSYKMDAYYDRLQYFPTYGDGRIVAAMDYIYYTSNNLQLKGISHTVNEEEMMMKLTLELDKHSFDGTDYRQYSDKQMEQGIVSKIWCLPNDKIVSDHFPVYAVFSMMDTCDKVERNKCDCCDSMDQITKNRV